MAAGFYSVGNCSKESHGPRDIELKESVSIVRDSKAGKRNISLSSGYRVDRVQPKLNGNLEC